MMVKIRVPCSLQKFTEGQAELDFPLAGEKQLSSFLVDNHRALYDSIYSPDGQIRPYVKIFVNQSELDAGDDIANQFHSGDEVVIFTAIAGG